MRIYKIVCHNIFPRTTWKNKSDSSLDLGVDEFGRDILAGMNIYVEILKKRGIKVHTVIVQGSRSKGKYTQESDTDVTIIADNLPKKVNIPVLRRLFGLVQWFWLSDFPLFMDVEPSGCSSPQEFLKELENLDIHALDAMYYGKIVYDDGFWVKATEKFKQVEKENNLQSLPMKKLLSQV